MGGRKGRVEGKGGGGGWRGEVREQGGGRRGRDREAAEAGGGGCWEGEGRVEGGCGWRMLCRLISVFSSSAKLSNT